MIFRQENGFCKETAKKMKDLAIALSNGTQHSVIQGKEGGEKIRCPDIRDTNTPHRPRSYPPSRRRHEGWRHTQCGSIFHIFHSKPSEQGSKSPKKNLENHKNGQVHTGSANSSSEYGTLQIGQYFPL